MLGDSGTIALVKSANSQTWLFPKGKIDPGESVEAAARREIEEETGLRDLEYIDNLGSFERPPYIKDGSRPPGKQIHMYLYAAKPHALLAPTKEILEARWVPLKSVMDVLGDGGTIPQFAPDRAWFVSVFERVRQAVQRD